MAATTPDAIQKRLQQWNADDCPVDPGALLPKENRSSSAKVVEALIHRLFQGPVKERTASVLQQYIEAQGELSDLEVLQVIRLALSTPE